MRALINNTDVFQAIYEGFLAGAIDALNDVDTVRECYGLAHDEIEDEEIESAMRSAAAARSYPHGTVVLTIDQSVKFGRRETLNGLVWAAVDVEAEHELSDVVQQTLAAELGKIDGSAVELRRGDVHRDDEPNVDATVYTAVLLPRGDYHAHSRTDRGTVLGRVHVINTLRYKAPEPEYC